MSSIYNMRVPKKPKADNLIKFLENLKLVYQHDYAQVERGLRVERPTTFRINLTKSNLNNVQQALRGAGFIFKKGPLDNSYYLTAQPKDKYISDTPSFIDGDIYIQEFASMIPPLVLQPQPGDKIIDMASAPGSKTTQMADMTKNETEILALEKHPLRILTLKHNINIQGATGVEALLANGIKFDKRNPQFVEFFDKALVDAPCSSEGRFNLNDPKSYKYWNIHKRKDMSKVQKGLLISAFRMLKPGGTLVYSTCTFGLEENEMVLDWLLQKIPDLKIEKYELPINNLRNGIVSWQGKNLNPQVRNALRIIPNEMFGGFFVAKIKKISY